MKHLLDKVVNWILYTSFFAACCSTGLCMATERLLIGRIPPMFTSLHALVFGSTLVVYNTHYLIKKSSAQVSDRFAWSQHYKLWHYIIFSIGAICCIGSVFFVNHKISILLTGLLVYTMYRL